MHRPSPLLLSLRSSFALSAAIGALSIGALSIVGCATPAKDASAAGNFPKPPGTDQYVEAVAQLKAGHQDAAIADLERAVAVNPSLRMARMKLGELYVQRKQFDKALPHLQAASDLDPYTLQNHYNLGLSLQVLNRLQEAAIAYLKGLRLNVDDFKCNMNLGLVYFALDQLDPAIFYLERATRVEPTNPRAWSNIGVVYDARGNATLAEASYRKALELDPNGESTLINLTSNLITQKKGADAVAIATELIKINDTPPSRKRLGDAYTSAGQWPEAIAAYDAAFKTDPKFTAALNAKAQMFITRYETELRLDDKLRQQALATWQASLKIRGDQQHIRDQVAQYADAKVFK